ncbi:MAG TPA: hypothetical protein VFV67_07220 [Actinophytocola sp.]|uniref:hypothetical protein n=1 Tax=Actinophytocola sp. TaxID=1872138 RepID=UPI002DBA44D6|nr:hypothetical protein [Actinophytocola sp.]HEU5470426.1 hypothetical protein [Actinophytocola sp.]
MKGLADRSRRPRRLPNTRRALTPDELAEINTTARFSGNDTILDAVLLRLHTETACRRGGVLSLRLADLDPHQCLIQLRENGTPCAGNPSAPPSRPAWPTTPHARGAVLPTDQLLRYRDGHPLTSRAPWSRTGC